MDINDLFEMAKNCRCLRCGECCFGFGVCNVPGYDESGHWTGNLEQRGFKPDRQRCRHLEPGKFVGKKWQPATCRLHNTDSHPWECKIFAMGLDVCMLGKAILNSRKK